MHGAVNALVAASAAAASIRTRTPSKTWRTLRLYHINPLRFDADDIADKDLGDAAGDAFFDISSITNYYACAPGSRRAPGVVCANQEITGKDIGVTAVDVEVEGAFGPYGTCNICGEDGRSPLNHSQTCAPGTYVCNCENGKFPPTTLPCTTQMGRENTSLFLGSAGIGGFCNGRSSSVAACAAGSAADKLQGFWYSPPKAGDCESGKCTWRVKRVVKRIRRDCHADHFYSSIESKNASCFAPCKTRNSTCWVDCFVDTTLGSNARTACDPSSGMTASQIVEAWTAPFDACPSA